MKTRRLAEDDNESCSNRAKNFPMAAFKNNGDKLSSLQRRPIQLDF